jgi:hypothetical protein
MTKTKKIIIGVVVFFVCLILFKNAILKQTLQIVGSQVVGTKVRVEDFSFQFSAQKIHMQGLKVYNPEGFPQEPLLVIDEIGVTYRLPALMAGQIHCPEVTLDLRELVVIKDQEGKMNVDELPIVKAQAKAAPEADGPVAEPAPEEPKTALQIDLLRLNVNKVVHKDYSGGGQEPAIKAYDVGLKDKEYKNITSPQQLVGLIIVEAMGSTAIKGAKIYGMTSLASIAGIGFLPAGAAMVLSSKDHFTEEVDYPVDRVYAAALALMQDKGTVGSSEEQKKLITGKMSGCSVAIRLEALEPEKTKITVSARKLLIPQPKIAGGIIHQIGLQLEEK